MKKIQISILTTILFLTLGCQDILKENPQSQVVPSLFNSAAGVLGGLAGVYNDIRGNWGTEGFTIRVSSFDMPPKRTLSFIYA